MLAVNNPPSLGRSYDVCSVTASCDAQRSLPMSTEHGPSADIVPNAAGSSEAAKMEDGEEIVYMGHLKFSIIFIALCLSVFQVALVRLAQYHSSR